MINKVEIHKELCNELTGIYIKKNADYGDSFAKTREEFGDVVILLKITEKLERLKRLMGGAEQQVLDESIDDTLKDLSNYCLLELIERKLGSD